MSQMWLVMSSVFLLATKAEKQKTSPTIFWLVKSVAFAWFYRFDSQFNLQKERCRPKSCIMGTFMSMETDLFQVHLCGNLGKNRAFYLPNLRDETASLSFGPERPLGVDRYVTCYVRFMTLWERNEGYVLSFSWSSLSGPRARKRRISWERNPPSPFIPKSRGAGIMSLAN